MEAAIFFFISTLSLISARPLSIFELSFEDVVHQHVSQDVPGATPANTYPLVIKPLNFAPAAVAPPAFLYPNPLRSMVRGAIPLFAPLRNFPYLQYLPVTTSFYLAEPNVRDPFARPEDELPSKVAAPPPSFLPMRDVHGQRKPADKSRVVVPDRKKIPGDPSFVRVVHFPSTVGQDVFSTRVTDNLAFSAPGGIAQSTQPHFSEPIPFVNSKVSPHLLTPPFIGDIIRTPGSTFPNVVEV